ncbi:MAG: ABC transporter substrate-binding protein [Lachnospiraceae bacterium]|nr:ABC transporter substrate-binding protein [Lachnospiraceae bacterium]
MKKEFLGKKVLSVLLVAALALTTAACGAKDSAAANTTNTEASANTDSAADNADSTADNADSAAATEGGNDVITIRSSWQKGMAGAIVTYGIEKGLFEEEGILFEDVPNTSNDNTLALISRNEIDIADGDPSTLIPGIYNGVPGTLVGNMWRYSGCFWLIANNDIQSIEDLKGKKVGTATAAGGMKLSVLKMLESAGLTEDDVILIANGVFQDAYAGFTTGEVDATIIHNPYASLSQVEGTGHPLGRAWDYIPDYYTGTLIASNDFIKNHPDECQRVVTAYYKVHERVKHEFFDDFVKWAAEYMNTDEDVMRDAIESEIDVWLDYPVIPTDRVANTIKILNEYGWLEEEITDFSTIIDNSFAEKAAADLGITDPYKK